MSAQFDRIPAHTRAALDRHAATGDGAPGNFIDAILEDRLNTAVAQADSENLAAIDAITKYVYNELPSECWGSAARVAAWRLHKTTGIAYKMALDTETIKTATALLKTVRLT